MGQYYKIIILADNKYTKEVIRAWMCPQSCNCGAKLMEHSYKKSKIVQVLEYLISPIGMFYKSRIVWAGDYAPPEDHKIILRFSFLDEVILVFILIFL